MIGKHSTNASASLRLRAMLLASTCAAASALALAVGASRAQAATRCTWGGTPDNPTGTIYFDPGNTATPTPFALKFRATGIVEGGGPCHGQSVTFDGQADAGSSCAQTNFEGRVIGLPGVAWLWGKGVGTLVRELDYDSNGNLVGSDQAIATTPNNDPQAVLPDILSCGTSQGFRSGAFSGEFELNY